MKDERSGEDPGRPEQTVGITLTHILTYKSNVSAARQSLEGLRFCPFFFTDSYLQVAAGPSQTWAQMTTGWSQKMRQMEGAGISQLEVSKGADYIAAS